MICLKSSYFIYFSKKKKTEKETQDMLLSHIRIATDWENDISH
jgi:hypothetical protein